MPIAQDQLAAEFAKWQQANPNATDADMAQAMQQAGISPLDLSLALGIDPNEGIQRYNNAIQQSPLSNPLTSNESSTGNPLLNATVQAVLPSVLPFVDNAITGATTAATVNATNAANAAAGSAITPEAMVDRLGGSLAAGAFNFATADNASERKNAALNTIISVIGGPAGALFKGFLDQFGFFKGDGRPDAVKLTPEQQVEQAYNLFQQDQQMQKSVEGGTEGQDGRLVGMIMEAEKLGMDASPWRDQLKNDFGIDSIPGDAPEGYVKDSQGHLRDWETGAYWIFDKNGNPTRTTPPLVNVAMPTRNTDAGGGGSSVSTDGSSTLPSSNNNSPAEIDPFVAEHPWKYSNGKLTNVLTGDVVDADPNVTYEEGAQYSQGDWNNNNTTDEPTDWMGILNSGGVGDVLAEMSRTGKSKEQVAQETGFSIEQIDQAISDYNSQAAGTGGTGAGTGGTGTVGDTINIDGQAPVNVGVNTPVPATTTGTNGTDGTNGTNGTDGTNGQDGKSGLLTSLVNNTPITSQLFKPELFKVENKVSGLFDLVMGGRRL